MTNAASGGGGAGPERSGQVDWRRNLFFIAATALAVSMSFSSVNPFIPIYLNRELGVHNQSQLALWTGLIGSVTPLAIAVSSPMWGWLADRVGRKTMLVRSIIWGGLFTSGMGLVQTATQLLVARLAQGVGSGVVAASIALVATETPRLEVPQALGTLSSVRAIGLSVGPMLAGLTGTFLPIRVVFLAAGAILLLTSIAIVTQVAESARPVAAAKRPRMREVLEAAEPGTLRAIVVLLGAQFAIQFAWSSGQQLITLEMIQLNPASAALGTGLAFGALNLAFAGAAAVYSRILPYTGFRRLSAGAGLLLGIALVVAAQLHSVALLVGTAAVVGAAFGAINPAISSMLGLEAPHRVRATVFGVSASAMALGMGGGPLVGGIVASIYGLRIGFYVGLGGAVAMALLMWTFGREPATGSEVVAQRS